MPLPLTLWTGPSGITLRLNLGSCNCFCFVLFCFEHGNVTSGGWIYWETWIFPIAHWVFSAILTRIVHLRHKCCRSSEGTLTSYARYWIYFSGENVHNYQKILGGIHNPQKVKSHSSEASLNPNSYQTIRVSAQSSPSGLSTQVVAREGGWLHETKLCSLVELLC